MKSVIKFFLPIISFSVPSIISFVLLDCESEVITRSAIYGIAVVMCILGSFLCGFLTLGDSGFMGMFTTASLVVFSLPVCLIALFEESGVLGYLLSGVSYFFVFICCIDVQTPLSIICEFILPFDITIIRLLFLSVVVPIVFIIIGVKLRLKLNKRLLDK